MGLLDRFLKDTAKKIGESLENGAGLLNELAGRAADAVDGDPSPEPEQPGKVPALLATGELPAKPSELRKEMFYDGGDGDIGIEYSFMLSGDFIFGNCGAAEVDYYAEYCPTGERLDDEEIPCFCVVNAAEKPIHEMIERYKHGGTPKDVYLFERLSDFGKKVYFRASAPFCQSVYYFYAIDRGLTWKNCYIGVTYGEYARGTALEKKLMNAVDEAVRTYSETIFKEER